MSSRTDLTKMGKHIFDLRKGLGYTQKQLGEMLDVSDKTVSKWEQGDIAPDITILTSLASALKVSVNEILYGEKEEKENEDEKSIKLLNLYTEQTKISLTKKIVLFIFTILVVAIFVFYVEDYFKWKVTKIRANDEFKISGYIFTNNKESKMVIDQISYISSNDKLNEQPLIKRIELKIIYNEKTIYTKLSQFDNPEIIQKSFNNYIISFEKKFKINTDHLKIVIDCIDVNDIDYFFIINDF